MKYQQIIHINAPITTYSFLKVHKFFKKNNINKIKNSIPLHFVIEFDKFNIFVDFRDTLLVSINNGI